MKGLTVCLRALNDRTPRQDGQKASYGHKTRPGNRQRNMLSPATGRAAKPSGSEALLAYAATVRVHFRSRTLLLATLACHHVSRLFFLALGWNDFDLVVVD